jgi:hypothetical protein
MERERESKRALERREKKGRQRDGGMGGEKEPERKRCVGRTRKKKKFGARDTKKFRASGTRKKKKKFRARGTRKNCSPPKDFKPLGTLETKACKL